MKDKSNIFEKIMTCLVQYLHLFFYFSLGCSKYNKQRLNWTSMHPAAAFIYIFYHIDWSIYLKQTAVSHFSFCLEKNSLMIFHVSLFKLLLPC